MQAAQRERVIESAAPARREIYRNQNAMKFAHLDTPRLKEAVVSAAGYDLLFDLCSVEAESRKWLTIIRSVSMLKGKRRADARVRVAAGRSFRRTGRSTKPRRTLTVPFRFGSANGAATRN
jgi:hypothetical protein